MTNVIVDSWVEWTERTEDPVELFISGYSVTGDGILNSVFTVWCFLFILVNGIRM